MTERAPRHGLVPRSVFARMIAVMAVMTLGLMFLVMGFFWGSVIPIVHATIERLVEDYAERIAADQPDEADARELSARVGLDIRYEGPAGAWSTDPDMPTVAQVRSGEVAERSGRYRAYEVVAAPQGGHYVFARELSGRMMRAHDQMLLVLLLVMAGVILATHLVLRRMLLPLRALGEGVTRLGAGELEFELPGGGRDEFGALTEAFNGMVRQVRERIQARDQLLLDVSHELRSPLTRMKVALELLPDDERRAGMAADVAEMEAMVTELLELERLRDGGGLRRERHDLSKAVREAAAAFEGRHPGVRVALPPGPVELEVDGEKLRVVLRNLLENAAKYALPDSRPVELSLVEEPGAAVVRVRDDGPGIPEADLGSLFEPFFRVDRSRSKRTGGYGLGLSICKRVVEAHGGTIAAENNPGRGATFTLRLPRHGERSL
jgi:signal transduction histidine kinase